MFNFITENNKKDHISNDVISEIEKLYKIQFPVILREYYLNHNGDKIKLCIFKVDEEEFGVAKIVPLKYGSCDFESIVRNDRHDEIIDSHLYPLARNEGGDYYYRDERNENVYMIYCDDIENPILICNTVKRFFELMEKGE